MLRAYTPTPYILGPPPPHHTPRGASFTTPYAPPSPHHTPRGLLHHTTHQGASFTKGPPSPNHTLRGLLHHIIHTKGPTSPHHTLRGLLHLHPWALMPTHPKRPPLKRSLKGPPPPDHNTKGLHPPQPHTHTHTHTHTHPHLTHTLHPTTNPGASLTPWHHCNPTRNPFFIIYNTPGSSILKSTCRHGLQPHTRTIISHLQYHRGKISQLCLLYRLTELGTHATTVATI